MNHVVYNEVKEITYLKARQPFIEKNVTLGTSDHSSFMTREKKEKVIHNDNATIIILDDGSKGVAKCAPDDFYDKTKGIKIAYLRAKIKSLNKELRQLVKT